MPMTPEQAYLPRLRRMVEVKVRQAQQIRNADSTAQGERAAGNAEMDAAAIRWVLGKVDPEPLAAAAE